MKMNNMNLRKVLIWGLVFFLFLTGIFAVSAYRSQIYGELSALKLIPESTPFTELYFENASSLPEQIIPNKPFSFAFTIHNVEGVRTTYPYTASLVYPSGEEIVFVSSTTTLLSNASSTINVQHIFHSLNRGAEVVVKLTSLNQQIDFHLTGDN